MHTHKSLFPRPGAIAPVREEVDDGELVAALLQERVVVVFRQQTQALLVH